MAQTANNVPRLVGITQIAQESQLKLKRVGRSSQYKTDCPFCGDIKQNLELNIDKDIFHCWACGTGGGVVRFYALLNNVSEFIAKEALYPARSGRPRFQHPALHLTQEQLKRIGFTQIPRSRPSAMSDKQWFAYRKRSLDWMWAEWKRYEVWERGFNRRFQKLLAEADVNSNREPVQLS